MFYKNAYTRNAIISYTYIVAKLQFFFLQFFFFLEDIVPDIRCYILFGYPVILQFDAFIVHTI